MSKKILSLLFITILSVILLALTGCGSGIESSMEDESGTVSAGIESAGTDSENSATYTTEAIERVKNKNDSLRHPGMTFEQALERCGVTNMVWTEEPDSTSVVTYVKVTGNYKGDQIQITHSVRTDSIFYDSMTVNGEIESISTYDNMMQDMMAE